MFNVFFFAILAAFSAKQLALRNNAQHYLRRLAVWRVKSQLSQIEVMYTLESWILSALISETPSPLEELGHAVRSNGPHSASKSLLDEKLSLARRTFLAILKWVNMLNYRLKVGATYVVWFHFSDTTS